jgi:beta-glucanase (GH16 family)
MPSSSLILSVGTILTALSSTAFATKYQQQESFSGKNWLDGFKFETYDLNNGFVNYVTEDYAKDHGLYKLDGDDVMFGVDASETLDYTKGPGRKSVRLEGTKNYNKGLFILDVKAMPGTCGMWPAFWSLGHEPWPVKGEVCFAHAKTSCQ